MKAPVQYVGATINRAITVVLLLLGADQGSAQDQHLCFSNDPDRFQDGITSNMVIAAHFALPGSGLTSTNVGRPGVDWNTNLAISTTGVGLDGYDVVATGVDIWGQNDGFRYAYEQRAGDFDAVVQVTRLDYSAYSAKAGLMVRDSLAPDSRYCLLFVTPSGGRNAYALEMRSATGGDASWVAESPAVPYPNAWLRLRRVGSTISALRSSDGQSWTLVGQVPMSFNEPVYLGLATSSLDFATTTTAFYRNYRATTHLAPMAYVLAQDSPGFEDNGVPAGFTVRLLEPAESAVTVDYTLSGTASNGPDFEPLGGTVSVPAGSDSVSVTVQPLDDGLAEGPETVALRLGPALVDATGQGHTGTLLNGVTRTTSTVPWAGAGAALTFDGVDDYVDVADGVYFNGNFTIEGWVYVRSYNHWSRLLDFGNGPGIDNVALALTEATSGRPVLLVVREGRFSGVFAPSPLPTNQWVHLAATLAGTNGSIYVNGTNVASGTLELPLNTVRTNSFLGRSGWDTDGCANALFDEVRIWNVAHSQAQIQTNMNRSLTGTESGLVACWRMDEPQPYELLTPASATTTILDDDLPPNGLVRQVYCGIPGSTVNDLLSSPKFPGEPSLVDMVPELESVYLPNNAGENYGQWLWGWLIPPDTGNYTFYLASDDAAQVYLSTDESPAHKQLIVAEPEWNGYRNWEGQYASSPLTNPYTAQPLQQRASASIPMVAGRHYYLEVLHKEGGGGDHLGVAWKRPGGSAPLNGSAPIPGTNLACRLPWRIGTPVTLVNPSFEVDTFANWAGGIGNNGPITGWSASGSIGINPIWPSGDSPYADNGSLPHGRQVAFIQSDSTLSQTVTGLVAGAVYQVRYRENARLWNSWNGTNLPLLEVRMGGHTIVPRHRVRPVEGSNLYHSVTSVLFVANASTMELAFLKSSSPPLDNTVLLDDVGVVPTMVSADPGHALSFDGVDDYVVFDRPVSNDFTLECWVKTTQVTGDTNQWWQGMGLIDGEVAGTTNDFGLSLGQGLILFGTGGNFDTTIRSGFVADGSWHFVTAARQRPTGRMDLYVDGNWAATGYGSTRTLNAPLKLRLGSIATGFNFFRGQLDEVRIWDVYQGPSAGPAPLAGNEPNLSVYYRLNEGRGANAGDSASHGYTGTLANGPQWVASDIRFLPQVETVAATEVTRQTATLRGWVNLYGGSGQAAFEWGTTTNYEFSYVGFTHLTNIATNTPISITVTGLTAQTTYHFRAYAFCYWDETSVVPAYGADQTFTTPKATGAVTLPPNPLTSRSTMLRGTVNPEGRPTGAWFEWGTGPTFGNATAATNVGSGTAAVPSSALLTGLITGGDYCYRTAASNSAGLMYGTNVWFRQPTVPSVVTLPATNAGIDSATLQGCVQPDGLAAFAFFEWGTSTSYGQTTAATNVGSGSADVPVASVLTGLRSGTTYHYRAVATNNEARACGADQQFVALSGGLANDGFNPDANGAIWCATVQADGNILVGGDFTAIAGSARSRIARLRIDGYADQDFTAGADGRVYCLAVQEDGKVLVGGDFTNVLGTARNRIARLNPDGTLDTAFDPGANGSVRSLALQADGRILVGGGFTTLGGQNRTGLGRLNVSGHLDPSFDAGCDDLVLSLAVQPDGKIVVGGRFTTLGGLACANIGRLQANGTLDPGFNLGADNIVRTLALQADGMIVVGGDFSSLAGQPRNYLGRLEANGGLDSAFTAGVDRNQLRSLVVQPDGKILVGGAFTNLAGQTCNRIGRLNPDGTVDSAFNIGTGANNMVYCLALQSDGGIVVGGPFNILGGLPRNRIGRLNADGTLDNPFNIGANASMESFAVQPDGKILVGGAFTNLAGLPCNGFGRLNADGTLDSSFNPGANGIARSLGMQPDGKILVGGAFNTLGGQDCEFGFGRLHADGTRDLEFVGTPYQYQDPTPLVVQADGKMVASQYRINVDGTLDPGFSQSVTGIVTARALQADGRILLGSSGPGFLMPGGRPNSLVVRLQADGTLDEGFNPVVVVTNVMWSSIVYVLAVQADSKILVGGTFTTLKGQPRVGIARLHPDGTLDDDFNPGLGGTEYPFVMSLAIQTDGAMLLSGFFRTMGGEPHTALGRLRPDGSPDAAFFADADFGIRSLAVQADGKILVGGAFTTLGGQPRSYIGRLTSGSAALQSIVVNSDEATLSWYRSGSGPEIEQVTFEKSTDGANYALLGAATRISGGWRLANQSLPARTNVSVRCRGRTVGGYRNGASGLIESVRLFYLQPNTNALLSDLVLNSGTLAPSFDSAVTTYAASASNEVLNVTVTPTCAHPGATIEVRVNVGAWAGVPSGTASAPLPLLVGVNPIEIRVTAQDGVTSRSYALAVTRAAQPPTVDTSPADNITWSSARLTGSVNPRGLNTTAWFEWGLTTNYGTVTATTSIGNGSTAVPIASVLSSLNQGSTYHFRLVARNSAGTVYGQDQAFTVLQGGNPSDGFNPATDGPVWAAAVQPDGKIVFGGDFTAVNNISRSRLARLNVDGTLDATFNPAADGSVRTLALEPDGAILVGGSFRTLGGVPRSGLARLSSEGSVDPTFDPAGLGAQVLSLFVQPNSQILVGGLFTTLGGQSRRSLGRLNADGSVDPDFNPGVSGGISGVVRTIALQSDGRIVVGGDFTVLGGQARTNLGRLDANGSVDRVFNPGANSIVHGLEIQPDGKILVAGGFTRLAGQSRSRIGRLNPDGSADAFTAHLGGGTVMALAWQPNGGIVLGGNFVVVGGVARTNLVRLHSDGSVDITWNAWADAPVHCLARQPDGKTVVGGSFTNLCGLPHDRIGRLHADGSAEGTFNPGANNTVVSLAMQPDGKILVGGSFITLGGQPRNRLGRLHPDGSLDAAFNPGADGAIYTMAVQPDGKVVVGGGFTSLGGQARARIGRLQTNGSLDTLFTATASNNSVRSLAIHPDGRILVGGAFTNLCGITRSNLGRLQVDGTLDPAFNPGADRAVYCTAVQPDGKILVAGEFTALGGQARSYLGRLNDDGTLDTGFDPQANSAILCLALQPDGKILVGGWFTNLSGEAHGYLGRLHPNGTLDTSFGAQAGGTVLSLAVLTDGRILVAGSFTNLCGQPRDRIGRLNPDGSLDPTFNPGADNIVWGLVVQADGKIVVGGQFSMLGGLARANIARLSSGSAAMQTIEADPDGTAVTWYRNGSGPEIQQVTFDQSLDGANYTLPGTGTRVSGGWQRSGLSLPLDRFFYVRARARVAGGLYDGSSGLIESVRMFYIPASTNADLSNLLLSSGAFAPSFDPAVTTYTANVSNSVWEVTVTATSAHPGATNQVRVNGGPWAFVDSGQMSNPLSLIAGTNLIEVWVTAQDGVNAKTYTLTVVRQAVPPTITAEPADDITWSGASLPGWIVPNGLETAAWFEWGTSSNSLGNRTPARDLGHGSSVVSLLEVLNELDQGTLYYFRLAASNSAGTVYGTIQSFTVLQGGNALDGFVADADGEVRCVALQADGSILLGGYFSNVLGSPRGRIARLYPDGTLNYSFNPQANGSVQCLAVQADGKILVGGEFTRIGSTTRNRIARLNADGTLDSSFDPGADGSVDCLAVQSDGKILMGGSFANVRATARNGLARLNTDGTLDSSFNPATLGIVSSLVVQEDGKILVGGAYTKLGGQMRNNIGRLNPNGSLDTSFNAEAMGQVFALALQPDGKIVVGGDFTTLAGQTRYRLGRLNPDGTLDSGFYTNQWANVGVRALAVQADGKILVGGAFTIMGGSPRYRLARLHPNGRLDSGFDPGANAVVNALVVQPDGKIVVGGDFTTLGGQPHNRLGRLNADGTLDSPFTPGTRGANDAVWSLALQPDGKVLAGGFFITLDGQTRNHVARLNVNGTLDSPFNPGTDGPVFSLGVQTDGKILVGGAIYKLGGQNCFRFGRLHADGTFELSFDGSGYDALGAMVVQADGRILPSSPYRLNVDGTRDPSFSQSVTGIVTVRTLQADGRILLGSAESGLPMPGGRPNSHIVRLEADGQLDDGFSPVVAGIQEPVGLAPRIYSLAVQADRKILVGGSFTTLNGQPRHTIARLHPDGTLDEDFNPRFGSTDPIYVMSLAIQTDGQILLSGYFQTAGGQPCTKLARLRPDGTPAPGFVVNANALIYSLAVQADGKILAGGYFTELGGQPRQFIGRLTSGSAALQSIAVNSDEAALTWYRSGSGPEIEQVTFEKSADGTNYALLGAATRINGGWRLANQLLPTRTNVYVRCRGRTVGGYVNGSSGLIESIQMFYLPPDTNAILANLALSSGPLIPSFDPAVNTYNASVSNDVSEVTVTPTSAHPGATNQVRVNDGEWATVTSGTASDPLPLNAGDNVIEVRVTAQDGTTTKTYTLTVTRAVVRPTIELVFVSDLTSIGAVLNGQVNPHGSPTTAWIEWGISDYYGNTIETSIGNGNTPAHVRTVLTGLNPDTTYHFRVLAWNRAGLVSSPDQAFTTRSRMSVEDGFNPNADGPVRAVAVQPDGRIVIGGDFTNVANLPRNHIARLNPDGTVDTSFNPGADSPVHCLALQADGKILVGGGFSRLGNFFSPGIGRLEPNGRRDSYFAASVQGAVYCLAVQADGKILAGGFISAAAGQPRTNLARFNPDGSLDVTFAAAAEPANRAVSSLALQADGKILVGGEFTRLAGQPQSYLGRLHADGSADTSFHATPDSFVTSLAVQADAKIVAGGRFGMLGGVQRAFIGRLNADGSVDTKFNPGVNNWVSALAIQPDGKILLGGYFTSLGGQTHNRIARLSPDGSPDSRFWQGADNDVLCLAVQPDGMIVVGGGFTALGGVSCNRIGRLYPGSLPDRTLTRNVPGRVTSLAVQPDGQILVAGLFQDLDGAPRTNLARLTPSGGLDLVFNPVPDRQVYCLAVQADGKILAGGFFSTLGGQTLYRLGRLNANGTLDTGFNAGLIGNVYALALQADGKILVGGEVLTATTSRSLIRLNPDGSEDPSFSSPVQEPRVLGLAVQADGMILVGGTFHTLGGQSCSGLGRLNTNGTLDLSFSLESGGQSPLVVQADGKILVGPWLRRLNADGTRDLSFNSCLNFWALSLALLADGKILAGGFAFPMCQEGPNCTLARLNADGSLDTLLDSATNNVVYALAVQPDGKVLVGGEYSTLDGQPRVGLARLTGGGAAWQSLDLNAVGTEVTWTRGGIGPEVGQVTFELSTNDNDYSLLGPGTRLGGLPSSSQAGAWGLNGLSLPGHRNFYIRARGRTAGGSYNASIGLIESVRQFYLPGTALVLTASRWAPTPGSRVSFPYTTGFRFNVLATTNVGLPTLQWTVLGPAVEFAPRQYQFIDPDAAQHPQRFYRVRSP